MFKNTCRRISEDSRILRFFRHCGPLGTILSFLANFVTVYFVGLNGYFWCPEVRRMLKNTCRLISEASRILRFFHHLGKISFLANFVKVYFVGLNAYFWCTEVRRMLKNTCRLISEDSRILKFFRHRSPLGKSHFWQILSKSILLV